MERSGQLPNASDAVARSTTARTLPHPYDTAGGTIALGVALTALLAALLRLFA